MPNYEYKCKNCEHCKDIFHPMKECESPSEKTQQEMKCDCGDFHNEEVYERQISVVEIGKYSSMDKGQKAKSMIERSKQHSKKFLKENGIKKI